MAGTTGGYAFKDASIDAAIKTKKEESKIDILKKAVIDYREENSFLKDNIISLQADLDDLTDEFNDLMNERDQLERELQEMEDI